MIIKFIKLNIGKYFIVSCLASIIDLFISYCLYKIVNLNYLLACNIGIVSGFVFQYFMCINYVFKKGGFLSSLIIYLSTFFLGVILADGTMWISYKEIHLTFIISKLFSMAVPFFFTYFIRKLLLGVKLDKEE